MSKRLVVVSNRLPVVLKQDDDGRWQLLPGAGGLVTALGPVTAGRGGMWIGWPGANDPAAMKLFDARHAQDVGYDLHPVQLSANEVAGYYHGFSNEVLWPLFHDMPGRCNFDPSYWPLYQRVNRKFAEAVVDNTGSEDYIWFQDYHLLLGAATLRELGVERRTGFFLHIPFPPLDLFLKVPWRFQLLKAMLDFDLIAFQTVRDRRNFLQCVRSLLPGMRASGGNSAVVTLQTPTGEVRVGAFPIGIDFASFARGAASKEVAEGAWYIHEKLPRRQLILSIDRLDYTKGIPHRIRAIGDFLERYPELRGQVTFVQVVVPSREEVPEYQALKAEIERLVGEINGRFTVSGWAPIHYIYRTLSRTELLSYYRTAELALVTPLKDGMNLVSKEYCACSLEENAVLVLSEFAGSAAQFHHAAVLVNPYDIEGVADAIHRALQMPTKERKTRMRRLRRNAQRHSVFWWVDSFLRAAISKNLSDFPPVDYYLPQPDETTELSASAGTAAATVTAVESKHPDVVSHS